jgi:hypothetical protein
MNRQVVVRASVLSCDEPGRPSRVKAQQEGGPGKLMICPRRKLLQVPWRCKCASLSHSLAQRDNRRNTPWSKLPRQGGPHPFAIALPQTPAPRLGQLHASSKPGIKHLNRAISSLWQSPPDVDQRVSAPIDVGSHDDPQSVSHRSSINIPSAKPAKVTAFLCPGAIGLSHGLNQIGDQTERAGHQVVELMVQHQTRMGVAALAEGSREQGAL